MFYGIAAVLGILWMLGLENHRDFSFVYYGLLALGALMVTATIFERRGRLERVKSEQPPQVD